MAQNTPNEQHAKDALSPPDSSSLVPGKPAPLVSSKEEQTLYTMHYRSGRNPHPVEKHFWATGDFHKVVQRAKRHCEIVNIRFISIEPFYSDLAKEESMVNSTV